MDNEDTLDQKIDKTSKSLESIAGTFSEVLRPPSDLQPKGRGVCVCVGMGIVGMGILAYLNAPWYAFLAEGVLVIAAAVLLMVNR